MRFTGWTIRATRSLLVMVILVALPGAFTACQDLFPPSTAPQPSTSPQITTGATIITARDDALLAVYQHLLGLAETYEAMTYLADFYTGCDNWSAESEFFKDGSGTWYVTVDMTGVKNWTRKPYWQQASWYVFKDGKVIPSNRFQANALRIEADLHLLSLKQSPASG